MEVDWDWSEVARGVPFENLCHDLVRALLGSDGNRYENRSKEFHSDHGADGWLAHGEFEGLPAPVAFSYKSTDPQSSEKDASKALLDAFSELKDIDRLRAMNPTSVVLAANHSIFTDHQDKLRALYQSHGFSRPKILDRGAMVLRLRNHLAVARRYFPKSGIWDFISTARTDDEAALRALLLDDPHAEGIPFAARHPNLPKAWPGNLPRLLITGKPLGGKSFALAQLLASCRPAAEVVVLKDLERSLLDGLSRLLSRTPPPLVLVVDNLQQKVRTEGSLGLLQRLLDGAGKLESLAGILLTYRSTDRENPDLDHQRYLAEKGFRRVELDEPPREFIEEVVDRICTAKSIEIDAEMRRAFIKNIFEWENTPGSAAAALVPYAGKRISAKAGFFPIDRQAFDRREDVWRSRFRQIAEDPTRVLDSRVLQLLALLRSSNELEVDTTFLRELLASTTGSSPSELDAAIERLRAGGWVRQADGKLHAHDVQVNLSTVGLVGPNYPESWLAALLAQIGKGVVADTRLCVSLVRAACRVFWRAEDFKQCEGVLSILARLPEPDYRDVIQRGLCRLRCGSSEPAFEDFHAAVALAPEAPEPVRVLLLQCLREGRADKGKRFLLALFSKRTSTHPEVLMEAARWAPALKAHRLSVLLGGRAARRLGNEPRSWTLLAESLYLMGRKSLSERLLVAILRQHPRFSWAMAIQASACIDREDFGTALALAQGALAEAANDPALHGLVAFLHLVTGESDLARREVVQASRLFPDWPDLLALEGRFLLHDGNFEAAADRARRALDRQQFISRYTRPQALMSLALSLVELGDPSEAERFFLDAKRSLRPGHV